MQIPEWMLMEEMELSKHFQLYASAFGVDVSMTQSQPIKSIQGTHKTPSTHRPPNHVEHQGESSTPRKPTIIRIRRRSQSNPETLIPTTDEIDISSLDEATQMSIAIERKIQKTSAHGTFKTDGQGTDDDEVPDEEVSPELLDEVSGNVMTSDELQRMQDALNSMLRNRCDSVQFDQGYGEGYMTEIMVKRADGGYSEFTESNYKYLHKNDTEYMYLMCINGIIKDYRQTGLLKVLKKVKKVNLDVKHGYADPDIHDEDAEYMRDLLLLPWPDLELHLSGDEFLRCV
ncbi:hypothetical protein Tco_1145029 [Tanacetum coccineum]